MVSIPGTGTTALKCWRSWFEVRDGQLLELRDNSARSFETHVNWAVFDQHVSYRCMT